MSASSLPVSALQEALLAHVELAAGAMALPRGFARLACGIEEFDGGMHPANVPSMAFSSMGVQASRAFRPGLVVSGPGAPSWLAGFGESATRCARAYRDGQARDPRLAADANLDAGLDPVAVAMEACGAHFASGFFAAYFSMPDDVCGADWIQRLGPMASWTAALPEHLAEEDARGRSVGAFLAAAGARDPDFLAGLAIGAAQNGGLGHCERHGTSLSAARSMRRDGPDFFLAMACADALADAGAPLPPLRDSGLLDMERLDWPRRGHQHLLALAPFAEERLNQISARALSQELDACAAPARARSKPAPL